MNEAVCFPKKKKFPKKKIPKKKKFPKKKYSMKQFFKIYVRAVTSMRETTKQTNHFSEQLT